jgi:hypothetical protein
MPEDPTPEQRLRDLDERLARLEPGGTADSEPEPEPAPEPQKSEGEQFVQELRDALNRNTVSMPGLLDR